MLTAFHAHNYTLCNKVTKHFKKLTTLEIGLQRGVALFKSSNISYHFNLDVLLISVHLKYLIIHPWRQSTFTAVFFLM